MGDQVVIKVLLVVVLVMLMGILLANSERRQTAGDSPLDLSVAWSLRSRQSFFLVGHLVGRAVGVGRGTDLLLYGLVVVFISHAMASKSRNAGERPAVHRIGAADCD